MSWPEEYAPVFSRLNDVRLNGKGWKARCPAHEDDHPSLGLWLQDGRLAMNCLARGCSLADIIGSLGLHMSAVFPPDQRIEPGARGSLEFVTSYPYLDESGRLWFEHVRWQHTVGPDAGRKTFSFRRPNPEYDQRGPRDTTNRKWLPNKDGCPVLLYRLPELCQALQQKPGRPVFLLEGEKAVDHARKAGLVATCSESGAGPGKFLPEHAEYLRGQNVLVIPDEDIPEAIPGDGLSTGLEHAASCCLCLYGIAASVKLVRLPGCKGHWGLDDWLDYQDERGRDLLRKLHQVTQAAPLWRPGRNNFPEGFGELYAEIQRMQHSREQPSRALQAGILLARCRAIESLALDLLEGRAATVESGDKLRAVALRLAAAAFTLAR